MFIFKDRLPKNLKEFLDEVISKTKGYVVYLGGGYLRDSYWNYLQGYTHDYEQCCKTIRDNRPKQPKDVDLFFIPENICTCKELPTIAGTYINYDMPAVNIANCRENVERVRGLFCRRLDPIKDVQFIIYDKTLSIASLAEDMDCSINQIMYHPKSGKQYMTEAFLSSHNDKVIEMMHEFETERMYKRLVRMKKKYSDYELKHKISERDWDLFSFKEKYEKKNRYSGRLTGSFIGD